MDELIVEIIFSLFINYYIYLTRVEFNQKKIYSQRMLFSEAFLQYAFPWTIY